ncbi:hypothetical protein HK100_003177 [Physocladia obscura]|uniref:Uncharacterized protein n=1 Tax=Physocladia obscura TaxID=109957 RepID=A0AAD5XAK7_9FUNG|nr:hypothetical protein HK100_003177 [Physocladia obscura]
MTLKEHRRQTLHNARNNLSDGLIYIDDIGRVIAVAADGRVAVGGGGGVVVDGGGSLHDACHVCPTLQHVKWYQDKNSNNGSNDHNNVVSFCVCDGAHTLILLSQNNSIAKRVDLTPVINSLTTTDDNNKDGGSNDSGCILLDCAANASSDSVFVLLAITDTLFVVSISCTVVVEAVAADATENGDNKSKNMQDLLVCARMRVSREKLHAAMFVGTDAVALVCIGGAVVEVDNGGGGGSDGGVTAVFGDDGGAVDVAATVTGFGNEDDSDDGEFLVIAENGGTVGTRVVVIPVSSSGGKDVSSKVVDVPGCSVDGIICTISADAVAGVSVKHTATVDAFAYIASSKRDKRFVYVDRDGRFACVVESSRYMYVYGKRPDNDGGDQWVVDLWEGRSEGRGDVRGVQSVDGSGSDVGFGFLVLFEDAIVYIELLVK